MNVSNDMSRQCYAYSPTVTIHRGAPSTFPENSLASIKEAINIAMQHPEVTCFIEMDVRRTHDGKLVLMHDMRVDRTLEGTGPIHKMSFHALQATPMKPHRDLWRHEVQPPLQRERQPFFRVEQADKRVPTLREVFDLVRQANTVRSQIGSPVGIVLELKPEPVLGSAWLSKIAFAAVGVMRWLGFGKAAASVMPENETTPLLADFLNAQTAQESDNPTPLMVFSVGALGKRDLVQFAEQLSPQTLQRLHQYQGMVHTPVRRLQSVSLPEFSWRDLAYTTATNGAAPFWFVGDTHSPDAVCGLGPEPADHLTHIFRPVNKPDAMMAAVKAKPDIIASDYPERLIEVIKAQRQRERVTPEVVAQSRARQPQHVIQKALAQGAVAAEPERMRS